MTNYCCPLLHIYQPPTQEPEVLFRINHECYEPLFQMLSRHPNARITLNINSVLLDLLAEHKLVRTINLIKQLVENNQIELMGSGKYHPIVPLIPKKEVNHQINSHNEDLKKYFGLDVIPKGFFPPELAISKNALECIAQNDFQWVILSGHANRGDWPYNYIQKDENSGLLCFYRDDVISNEISFKKITAPRFVNKLKTMFKSESSPETYIITAMDGETFGHHHRNYETEFLGAVLSMIERTDDVKCAFVSDLIDLFPAKKSPTPKASTWSTSGEDLDANVPYPLWKHPDNAIHKIQYRMLNALYGLMEKLDDVKEKQNENGEFEKYYQTARFYYDRALHSCWLWWASQRPMWSPNLIYKGAHLVTLTALNAQLAIIKARVTAEEYFEIEQNYEQITDANKTLLSKLISETARLNNLRTF